MIKAHRFFNLQTRHGLNEKVGGYLSKDDNEPALLDSIRKRYDLEQVYRFDIGKNPDGFTSLIGEVLDESTMSVLTASTLDEYPDNHYQLLIKKLAEKHGISRDWFLLSTGLDSLIDLVTRVFLSPSEQYLLPVPNFYLYEEYSNRTGAVPLYMDLHGEDCFRWTRGSTETLVDMLAHFAPKLTWISNPINPTGQLIPLGDLELIVRAADSCNSFIVIDEAYGEYTDPEGSVCSASSLAAHYQNLMVLRTFSKIYALPSIRVGYLICSSPDILRALRLYLPYFPVTWFSLYVAQIAAIDDEFLSRARSVNRARKERLIEKLGSLTRFIVIPSDTNTLLVKHRDLTGNELRQRFLEKGILTSDMNQCSGIEGAHYHRVTVRSDEDNDYLVEVCRQL